MDPGLQVALVGVISTLLLVTGTVVVAALNSRKEKADTAENAVIGTLRERIVLKDEIIADLKADIARLEEFLKREKAKNEARRES